MPRSLRAGVVYKFQCAGCNACYVGQTTRHFDTRVHEHLHKSSQPSSVYKHLDKNPRCRAACDVTCFKIIDRDVSSFRLEVKETIHNEWVKPTINKQKKIVEIEYSDLKLSFFCCHFAFFSFFSNGRRFTFGGFRFFLSKLINSCHHACGVGCH